MKFKDWHDVDVELPEGKSFAWRPSAYAFIERDGGILLMHSKLHGMWDLPGGAIELGETIQEALAREVMEETGYAIECAVDQPIHLKSTFFYSRVADEFYQCFMMVFRAKVVGEPRAVADDREVGQVKWVAREELKKLKVNPILVPAVLDAIKRNI